MAAIADLGRRYGFCIVEDASHAIGALHQGTTVGSCRWSDIAVFSFHPVKILTTGEGGMALTNNDILARRMQLLRSHGITRSENEMEQPCAEPWYYEQLDLGFNYRITDIQAALGMSQLRRLDTFIAIRNRLAAAYDEALHNLPITLPVVRLGDVSSWHLYTVHIGAEHSRDAVFQAMREAGIGVNVHYIPVHLQPFYRRQGFKPGMFPEAEVHGRRALTIPLHTKLSRADQDTVITALTSALQL
jgi:dTDP-4-amino-4,6-dideoxygalactose transaminase